MTPPAWNITATYLTYRKINSLYFAFHLSKVIIIGAISTKKHSITYYLPSKLVLHPAILWLHYLLQHSPFLFLICPEQTHIPDRKLHTFDEVVFSFILTDSVTNHKNRVYLHFKVFVPYACFTTRKRLFISSVGPLTWFVILSWFNRQGSPEWNSFITSDNILAASSIFIIFQRERIILLEILPYHSLIKSKDRIPDWYLFQIYWFFKRCTRHRSIQEAVGGYA